MFHKKHVLRFSLKKWDILKNRQRQNQFYLGNGDFGTPIILQILFTLK